MLKNVGLLFICFLLFSGCESLERVYRVIGISSKVKSDHESDHVSVQHILIAFKGSLPGKEIARSESEAEKLALKVLAEAQVKGASFDALVKAYSDDQVPGVYKLANFNIPLTADYFKRSAMVSGFGDLSFQLQESEVGLVKYDEFDSPYGFHIIKRLQ